MTPLPAHPRLARRARLVFDRHAERWMLVYPERGLALNASAVAVVRLLDGTRTMDAVLAQVAADHGTAVDAVEGDVRTFMAGLHARNLLEDGA
jgi:coenzyme PQQ biosynthesis protein PqqD